MANRTDAKKVAALECCKRLYELKELDPENLLPVTKEKWLEEVASFTGNHAQEQTQPGEPKPGTQRRVQYYAQKVRLLAVLPLLLNYCCASTLSRFFAENRARV